MARRLTREEGLFVRRLDRPQRRRRAATSRVALDDPKACVVTILCDTGERYLSKLYNDEWMRENQLLDAERTTLAQLVGHKGSTVRRRSCSVAPGRRCVRRCVS